MRFALPIASMLVLAVSAQQPFPEFTLPYSFAAAAKDQAIPHNSTAYTVALEVIRGFASGFLDEDITDIGTCGTKAIEIGNQFGKVFADLFSGNFFAYLGAFNDIIAIFTLIPQEFKACSVFGELLTKVVARYHMTLNIKQFFQNMFFNIIFHLFDITSSIAYSIEGAIDAGYFEAGKSAGKAMQIFLFNDGN